MAISTTRAKQIRKNFRKNYGPKPKVTTADVKGRRRAVKAGQTTYTKKDGTTGQLTRKQTLRTKQKLNQTAKAKKKSPGKTKPPRIGAFPGEIIATYPNADDMTFVVPNPQKSRKKRPGKPQLGKTIAGPTPPSIGPNNTTRVKASDMKKKRPGSAKLQKLMRGGVAKKKMRGGGMAKMAKKKMMRGGSVQAKKMRRGGMAKMASKKKMMRGGMAKKKK